MAFERLEFTKTWENPQDFPTYEQSEAQVRADLQLLHEQTRQGINRLVDALNKDSAAKQLPFSGEGLQAKTVQEAILETYAATKHAAAGQIVDGSVGKEKLSEEVLQRCYGGRPWVSMDLPEQQTPADGFPVGQLWLRPAFTLTNLAGKSWSIAGGTVKTMDGGWKLTGNGSSAEAQLSQKLTGLGAAGDSVTAVLRHSGKDSQMTGLALYLNGKRCDLTTDSVFSAELDSSGALQAVVTATWPAAALAVGSVSLTHWTVVNTAKAERELNDCRPVSDWAGLVEQLIPFQTVTLPRCQYQQVQPGRWEQVGWSVLPVEQGGTGLTSVADGAMLMGKGGAFAPLAAGSNASLLRMRGGMPVWETLESAVAEAKGLRLVSGTYTGNGAARTVTLSVQPQVLWIWGDSYNVATLTQEAEHIRTCRQENSYYESVVKLSGSSLSFYNKSGSDGHRATCNVAGTTYRWLALVEVTA